MTKKNRKHTGWNTTKLAPAEKVVSINKTDSA